ncbi:MAG TPA: hypothetical protein DD490_12950, partial [Acidobacteria bacterium]|nr:hypothetical protein [Acidobacteriota bacterium]
TAASDLDAARQRARAAAFDVANARAALLEGLGSEESVPVVAPVGGRVLRVCEECERVVPAGTALVELGDLGELEVVVDVLSTDAVQ